MFRGTLVSCSWLAIEQTTRTAHDSMLLLLCYAWTVFAGRTSSVVHTEAAFPSAQLVPIS